MALDPTWMQEIILDGTIEHNYCKHYLPKTGDTYCEIGAFWGRSAVVMHRLGCSKIILVEPSPRNVDKIHETMSAYGNFETTIIQKAVSDHKGKMDFITRGNPAGNRLVWSKQESEVFAQDNIAVDVDTLEGILDSTGLDHVDLLGCDNEGNEVILVQGAGKWLSEHKIKNVAICVYHKEGNPEQVMEILIANGYKDVVHDNEMVFGHA